MKLYQSNYNWFEVEYADSKSLKKLTPSSKLNLFLNKKIPIHTKNYHEALKYNAHAVADYVKQPLNILLSGGVDSEVVVRINKDLGIKQKIYTFQFEDNHNIRDVESAKNICKNLNIPIKVIKFNLKRFFENEAEAYYKRTFSPRVELLPRFKWHEMFDNYLIFGDGEPYLRRSLGLDYSQKSDWTMTFSEHEFFHMFYTSNIERYIIRPWYQFTAEIHGNFLKLDVVKKIANDEIVGKQSTFSNKVNINRTIWPAISSKPKLVGYEGVSNHPGFLPEFMINFRDSIMIGVQDTEIHFPLSIIRAIFK